MLLKILQGNVSFKVEELAYPVHELLGKGRNGIEVVCGDSNPHWFSRFFLPGKPGVNNFHTFLQRPNYRSYSTHLNLLTGSNAKFLFIKQGRSDFAFFHG